MITYEKCPRCEGLGFTEKPYKFDDPMFPKDYIIAYHCGDCNGSGLVQVMEGGKIGKLKT